MLLSVVLLQLGELFYCRLWVGGVCYYGMYYDLKKYLLLLRVALILELLYNSLLAVALGCVMLETILLQVSGCFVFMLVVLLGKRLGRCCCDLFWCIASTDCSLNPQIVIVRYSLLTAASD